MGGSIAVNHGTPSRYEQQQADGSNHAIVEWLVPEGTPPGVYRIRHEGASAGGPHSGITNTFELLPCEAVGA